MDWRKDLPIGPGSRVESTVGVERIGTVVGQHGTHTLFVVWDEWAGKEPTEVSVEIVQLAGCILEQLASMTLSD